VEKDIMGVLQEVYVVDRRDGERDNRRADSGGHIIESYKNNYILMSGDGVALVDTTGLTQLVPDGK